MIDSSLPEGRITDEALETYKQRVGGFLRIQNIFNELASSDAIRKFCDGIGDPNPLWRDEAYAEATNYQRLPSPPSWLSSVFPTWVLQGLPGVHAFQTSTDWEFFRPVMVNDRITPQCIFSGFRMIESGFAGRSVLERQQASYYNQEGELVGRANVAGLRTERSAVREKARYAGLQLPHPWKEDELKLIEEQVLAETIRGSIPRYWEDVEPGEQLPQIVRGPLGLSDIIAYCTGASPYEEVKTPYEKLKSLPKAETYLRDGTTFETLDAIASQMSDNEFAERMVNARFDLFSKIKLSTPKQGSSG